MTRVGKKMLPISSSDDLDDYNVEYSFALEYKGPPVSYEVPNVSPVDVGRIPTARTLAKVSDSNDLSIPVVQPVVRRGKFKKKVSKEPDLASKVAEALASVGDLYPLESSDAKDSNREGEGDVEDDSGCKSRASDENGSWGTLGFSDSRDDSNDMSGSSDVEDLLIGDEESEGFADVSFECNFDIEKSNVGVAALSLEIIECAESENHFDEAAPQGDRAPIVTFRDVSSSSDATSELSHYDETRYIPERPIARFDLKKGACQRCLKGNRFSDKEDCFVCGARYCAKCVLRAMGSMPEGRKCISCIGFEIDESRRGSLGRCSRMLKKLMMEGEIERILEAEVSCKANQLPSYLFRVNGQQLSVEELLKLQNCKNPPRKLKPGNYWYDKVSGFWGKEGKPPTQIISPQMMVGSQLERDASNGTSGVLINGREITKQECWVLQFVGIRCEGNPSYWVSADGACEMEGMNNVIGNIWGRTGVKLLCSALSLPIPPEGHHSLSESNGEVNQINRKTHDMQYRLLLVGLGQSGTSTIFKQAKILHNVPFTEDERQNIKVMIQRNLYSYVAILLEARERFEDEYFNDEMRLLTEQPSSSEISVVVDGENIYAITPRLKLFSDWLLQVKMSGNLEAIFPASTREYAPAIEELWKNKAFQATYRRRTELDLLPGVANYFLARAVEIAKVNYEPSDMDILYAEGINSTNGVASMDFSFSKISQESYTDYVDQDESFRRFQLTRVNARSLGHNCKWLEMFEDIDVVLFCVSLTDYDEFYENSDGTYTNKIMAARTFFETVVRHPTFAHKHCLLILNKFDMLEEKIEKVPLAVCDWFEDFNPVISHHHSSRTRSNAPSLAQRAFHYIAMKFKRLFSSHTGRKLYISCVTGLEVESVDEVLKYVREILRWEEEKQTVSMTEWSVNSPETSTIS